MDRLSALLIEQGVRPTRQRIALASILFEGGHKHVTAEQIVSALRQRKDKVSLATVYNNLHAFTKVGLLREIAVDHTCSYFDTNTTIHGHFFDEVSGLIHDIPDQALHMINLPTPPGGRKIKRVDITIRLCAEV
ncbi:MAG: Fur family transcriptional regulator [Alphaproteobacteria bacterium]|nr:Fur family transcriptional regulator [Alphaproteobacteria bacterium]